MSVDQPDRHNAPHDQPTTEPSAVERAWDDWARAALRSEGYEVTDHAAVLASNPHRLAPAPQPAAERYEASEFRPEWMENRIPVLIDRNRRALDLARQSTGDLATRIELMLSGGDQAAQPAADLGDLATWTPAEVAASPVGASRLIQRLDAVVTAVRDLHQPVQVDCVTMACALGDCTDVHPDEDDCPTTTITVCAECDRIAKEVHASWDDTDVLQIAVPHPCPTVRALDGGAR